MADEAVVGQDAAQVGWPSKGCRTDRRPRARTSWRCSRCRPPTPAPESRRPVANAHRRRQLLVSEVRWQTAAKRRPWSRRRRPRPNSRRRSGPSVARSADPPDGRATARITNSRRRRNFDGDFAVIDRRLADAIAEGRSADCRQSVPAWRSCRSASSTGDGGGALDLVLQLDQAVEQASAVGGQPGT
jgi:hypothetical protein